MCDPHQRLLRFFSVRLQWLLPLVVRYILSRPLEQLLVYYGWEREWRASRCRRLICWEFEADEYAGWCEELVHAAGPDGADGGVESA
jgi:hypothetical protein